MSRLDPVFRGKMNAKRDVALDDKQAYYIWRCSFRENQEIELILRKRRKKRSKAQNSSLWGVPYKIISEITGMTEEEVHEACKWRHLRVRRDGFPDTVKSTKDLSTVEFNDYYAAIQRDGAECVFNGIYIYIPDPNEVEFEQ